MIQFLAAARDFSLFPNIQKGSDTLTPTQLPTEWIPGSLSFEVKSPGCETELHIHLMPWLAVSGITPLLHPNALAACRKTHLVFPGWHSKYNLTIECTVWHSNLGGGQEIFLFSKMSWWTVGALHPPSQWVTGFFPRGKARRTSH